MDDFIDDDDDDSGGMAPVAGADLATGRFASMSLGSPASAPTGECLIAQQPSLAADAFAAELKQYSADVMYLSATDYIQQMAQGVASLSSTGASGEPVSASIALRVWAEFECWIRTVRPAVQAQYASQPERDKAKRQMDHLLKLQKAGADVDISIKPLPQWVPEQYAEVANAVVATPLLHMRAKDRSPSRLPTDKAGESSRLSTSLVIKGRHLPEVVHVLHDQGVAQRTAFSEFYCWCQHSDDTNNTGEDICQSRCSLLPLPPPPQLDDAMNVSDSADGQKPQLLRKRTRGGLTSSSDNDNTHGGEAEVAEQLALSSPMSQQQQQQPKEPDTPKMPVRGRWCNICLSREESASMLEMHCVKQQALQAISRCSREVAAAAASRRCWQS
ncbi:hypothetical protein GGF42_004209 [Coemansia sp. RSA 2424]|nr:hypothetical protein GGF42_004209 [Coemansia sp. RSA 2424]